MSIGDDLDKAPEDSSAVRLALLPRNDFGLGERYRERFGAMVAFTPERGVVAWNGRVWATDHHGEATAMRFAHETARLLRVEEVEGFTQWAAANVTETKEFEKAVNAFRKFATDAGNAGKTAAMLSQARPYLTTEIATFDPDRFLLCVQNGTLRFAYTDIDCFVAFEGGAEAAWAKASEVAAGLTERVGGWIVRPNTAAGWWDVTEPDGGGIVDVLRDDELAAGVTRGRHRLVLRSHHVAPELLDHSPSHRITRMAKAAWDPAARAPLWEKHLETVLPEASEREWFQRAMGYAMTGSTESQCFLMVQGKGADGKSTTFRVLDHVLGTYAAICDVRSWLEIKQRSAADASPDMADMSGDTRLLYCEEPPKGSRVNEALIKGASGGVRMKARQLQQALFEFEPRFLLVMAFNDRPRITGGDDGFWRRMRFIQFPRQFTRAEQLAAGDMYEKLIPEAAGILNWLIEGYGRWKRHGLAPTERMQALINSWRANANPFHEWFTSCVAQGAEAGTGARTRNKDLYESYKEFCEGEGLAEKDILGSKAFSNQLDNLQIGTVKIRGDVHRVGVRLRPPGERDDDGGAA